MNTINRVNNIEKLIKSYEFKKNYPKTLQQNLRQKLLHSVSIIKDDVIKKGVNDVGQIIIDSLNRDFAFVRLISWDEGTLKEINDIEKEMRNAILNCLNNLFENMTFEVKKFKI